MPYRFDPRRILFEGTGLAVPRSYGRLNDSVFLDCFVRCVRWGLPSLARLSSSVEVDSFLESLRSAIIFALDNQAPLRSFPVRRPGARWLSAILRARFRERNYLFRRAKGSGSVLSTAEYRRSRDVFVIDLRRAQNDHCLEKLTGLRDLAKLWRQLASLGLVRPSRPLNFITADELNSFLCLFGLLGGWSCDGPWFSSALSSHLHIHQCLLWACITNHPFHYLSLTCSVSLFFIHPSFLPS